MRLIIALHLFCYFPVVSFFASHIGADDSKPIDSFLEDQDDDQEWSVEKWQKFALANVDRLMKNIERTEKSMAEDEAINDGINKDIERQEKEMENLEYNIDEATSEIKKFDTTLDETTSEQVKVFAEEQKKKWDAKLESLREKHEQLKDSLETSQNKKTEVEKRLQLSSNRLRQYLMLAELTKLPKTKSPAEKTADRQIASHSSDHTQVLQIVSDVRKSRQQTQESIKKIKTSMKTGP